MTIALRLNCSAQELWMEDGVDRYAWFEKEKLLLGCIIPVLGEKSL
jgi:hypothetical protein